MLIALDWDGTTATYKLGPDGRLDNEAFLPGVIEFIRGMRAAGHAVQFFSARFPETEGVNVAMAIDMLAAEGLPFAAKDFFYKPPADHIFDDRAFRFQGDWNHWKFMKPLEERGWMQIKPWYYGLTGWRK